MWEQYRKYLIPTQLFILAMALTMYFYAGVPVLAILLVVLTMELGAFAGAIWGARIRRNIESKPGKLPLDR